MAPKFLFTLLTFLSIFHGISSADPKYEVTNQVPNTPGGIRYTQEIGIPYTKEILPKIANFIWSNVFQQSPSERKPLELIEVFIDDLKSGAAGETWGFGPWGNTKINVDSKNIQRIKGNVKEDHTIIMYHEMTHILQWSGKGKCPGNVTEGVAEYTIIKAKFVLPGYPKPGEGDRWDQGYGQTARFLEYCDGLVPGFVAKFNKKIKTTYDVSFFKELTGKPVEQLWKEYKAKYGK